MRTHHLKIKSLHFAEVCLGNKTAELRKDDRGFYVADFIVFHELDPNTNLLTGHTCQAIITHIIYSFPEALMPRYACLSIRLTNARQ